MSEIPLLEVKHLKKYYCSKNKSLLGKQEVKKSVNDVSFTVSRGKIFGLIGESGSGKTTIGKTVLYLQKPTAGQVKFNNETIFDVENNIYIDTPRMNRLRKDMQLIFQDPLMSLDPRRTIFDILAIGVRKHRIVSGGEMEEYCGMILEQCGISPDDMWRYPHQFSGGQRQRIGIARALAVKPEFIVCDEPTSALDVSVQSSVLNLLLDLKENLGLTYLFISHNMDVVKHFCDEIAVMHKGRIVEQLAAKDFDNTKHHPYTQSLLDALAVKYPWLRKSLSQSSDDSRLADTCSYDTGCSFIHECPYANQACQMAMPTLQEVAPGHLIACHNYSDLVERENEHGRTQR